MAPRPESGDGGPSRAMGAARPGDVVRGWTVGVEYGRGGTSLWVRLADGSSRQVRLHPADDWSVFEKESREVEIRLDASGEYADTIRTLLTV